MTSTLPPIDITSEEYGYSEYLLQLQLNAPHLQISECYDLSTKQITAAFKNFCSHLTPVNVVDVFVPAASLGQPITDIASHGLRINQKNGFRFQAGAVPIDGSEETYELVHMVVALGNVYYNQKPGASITEAAFSEVEPTSSTLPIGYHSIRVSNKNEFVVFNPSQINTLRLIRLKGKENVTHDATVKHICHNCGQPNATIWCDNDSCKLCEKCDASQHKTKLTSGHTRHPLAEALINVQRCPVHPDTFIQYYCTKCHLPVCLQCKVRGNHSKGEFAKHHLIDLKEAYDNAVSAAIKPNQAFITREKLINQQLNAANEKLKEIQQVQINVEAEITRIAAKAIEDARQQSSARAQQVKAIRSELIRKLADLQTHKDLLAAQQKNNEPLSFVQASHFSDLFTESHINNDDLPLSASEVDADLTVYGRIEVSPPRPAVQPKSRGITPSQDNDVSQTTETQLEAQDPHITTLTRMAKRKEGKYQESGQSLSFLPFEGSAIITNPELQRRLYLCFPFKGQPVTHRMYYSETDGRTVTKIHKLIDNHGITCIVVKSGENIFGGFAASKWNTEGKPFGKGSSSFLFQLNKDAFIPNHGQTEEPVTLFATEDTLTFGKYDLALNGNLEKCSSIIENSYGVGFQYNSNKARTFLAGAPEFRADAVEVWGFFSGQSL
ncbi:B-box zinc finger family protein [Trichomonas vaginalis G3]|uniref:B-box zinc finger family protein n=1 Tax=Trichomonas vaginalis (strain ATCC PRA-98 / G3) TaxID=412133 RepID=A2F8B4_TRIV3|nr:zinc ion binding [Trichomonas vaginalis G3]EAX98874.1 B-box zinc finger family protein [Trichomonas vaginalis G3]KAI5540548.1 zinc ion binding [Trichomonas vaginalis G3]|eukprot:XP_001311804.1 B-box zinc finger family protein [Trichomonas vaginalis G3]